jgi:cytochrome c
MKKAGIIIGITILLAACGGNNSKPEDQASVQKDITTNPDYKNGLALVAKYKCVTCHAIDDVVTGPPYRKVAEKYASYPDTIVSHLARKVITGGNGVWGEVFMTPHPDVSKEDAETMVRYILLLKK